MVESIRLERVQPGHTRWLQLSRAPNGATVHLKQSSEGPERAQDLPRIRLRRGQTMEQVFEQELVAKLLAHGYRVVPGQGMEVDALVAKLAPDVERERAAWAAAVAAVPSRLAGLPGVTVTRGAPMTEADALRFARESGVHFAPSYLTFLTTVGSLRAVYAGDRRAELLVLGAPLDREGHPVDLASGRTLLAKKLEARRAAILESQAGADEAALAERTQLRARWEAQPSAVVPVLTMASGDASDLAGYDGFADRSEPDTGEVIFGFDANGRLCQCGLRYGDILVEGDQQHWCDFDDVYVAAAATFEASVQQWNSGEEEY